MATTLMPGQNIPLTKENPNLNHIVVGLGWDIIQGRGPQVEMIPGCVMTGKNGNALSDNHFLFFNQLTLPDSGSVVVDNDEDIDQIDIYLNQIPSEVEKIVFLSYINPDRQRPGTCESVRSAYIKLSRPDGSRLTQFDINRDDLTVNSSGILFAELYRYKNEWKFRALGQQYSNGIKDAARDFGVNL